MMRSSSRLAAPLHRLLLGDPGLGGDVLIRPRGDRELALHQVQQALVELGERDRRALLAAAQLGSVSRAGDRLDPVLGVGGPRGVYCSHRAGVLGVVGDDDVGPGAADRGQRLQHRRPLFEIAGGRRGLQHRVLAADVVGGQRHPGRVLDPADHVQVGQRRLDHEDVGALLDVEPRLADRLVGVGGIHLVAATVAERRRRVGRVAERPVEGRGELGRVGHDRRVDQAVVVQRGADRAHAAVHHVAGAMMSAPARACETAVRLSSSSVASLSTSGPGRSRRTPQ